MYANQTETKWGQLVAETTPAGWSWEIPSIWAPLCHPRSEIPVQSQRRRVTGKWAPHWSREGLLGTGGSVPRRLYKDKPMSNTKTYCEEGKAKYWALLLDIPVMRLQGSKTSIFSARSIASGDAFGNFDAKDCLGTFGSCLIYFLALSLLRNPRSESSGEPSSCFLGTIRKFAYHNHTSRFWTSSSKISRSN